MDKQKILNKMDGMEIILLQLLGYLFVYGFAIGFMIIGVTLAITSYDVPRFVSVINGLAFFFMGLLFLFKAIKFTLENIWN